jgi:hypothetical protein
MQNEGKALLRGAVSLYELRDGRVYLPLKAQIDTLFGAIVMSARSAATRVAQARRSPSVVDR